MLTLIEARGMLIHHGHSVGCWFIMVILWGEDRAVQGQRSDRWL